MTQPKRDRFAKAMGVILASALTALVVNLSVGNARANTAVRAIEQSNSSLRCSVVRLTELDVYQAHQLASNNNAAIRFEAVVRRYLVAMGDERAMVRARAALLAFRFRSNSPHLTHQPVCKEKPV